MFRRVTWVAVLAAAAGARAQQFTDPFNYPAGTTIPGYTEQRGDWRATGTAVQASFIGSVVDVVTNDALTDGVACVESVAIHDGTVKRIQAAGPVAWYLGSWPNDFFFAAMVLDVAAPYDGWDSYEVRVYTGFSYSVVWTGSISPAVPRARIRLQGRSLGGRDPISLDVFFDTNLDGLWELTASRIGHRALLAPGKIGVNGYQGGIVDDVKYFGGALALLDPPRVGTSIRLAGHGGPSLAYQGACSRGHSGIPLGSGLVVPLEIDVLFLLSLTTPTVFANFAGTTDASGAFTMTIHVPLLPELVGSVIWASALTYSPMGVAEIMPDVEIKFVN